MDGLYFLHEHPDGATSWNMREMINLIDQPGVFRLTGHMCPHGMKSWDVHGEGLVLKPTGWATNSPCLAQAMSRKCSNEVPNQEDWHRHITLVGGKASACEVYPPRLVETILKALKAQLIEDGLADPAGIGSVCCEEPPVGWDFFIDAETEITLHCRRVYRC